MKKYRLDQKLKIEFIFSESKKVIGYNLYLLDNLVDSEIDLNFKNLNNSEAILEILKSVINLDLIIYREDFESILETKEYLKLFKNSILN